jgi:hypothetical protein
LRTLRDELALMVEGTLQEETAGLPASWRTRISRAIPFQGFWSVSLVSCASSQWCGAPPETGLPGAAAVLLLAGATAVHSLHPVGAVLPGIEGYDGGGDPPAARILAGDALIPLAARVLCRLDPPVCVHLADLLMKTAGGILEAMSYGNRSDMTEKWTGRLASLAARMGAVSAGAEPGRTETAALAGFSLGQAAAILSSAGSREANVEAERMLGEALETLGGDSRLFEEIAGFIAARGTGDSGDLFAALEPD